MNAKRLQLEEYFRDLGNTLLSGCAAVLAEAHGSALVAALFCRSDTIYATIPGVDVWDQRRDARRWQGGYPCIAHPPCGPWGSLRACYRGPQEQKELGHLAVRFVRENGGVLEHPARSKLWEAAGMPKLGERDKWGGWTMSLSQYWFGHRANKATWLYIVGCNPKDVPPVPMKLGEAPCVVTTNHSYKRQTPPRPELHTAEREATPKAFAEWLVQVARLCRTNAPGEPRREGKL